LLNILINKSETCKCMVQKKLKKNNFGVENLKSQKKNYCAVNCILTLIINAKYHNTKKYAKKEQKIKMSY